MSFTWKQNLLSRTPNRRRLNTVHEARRLGGPVDWLLRVVRHNVGPWTNSNASVLCFRVNGALAMSTRNLWSVKRITAPFNQLIKRVQALANISRVWSKFLLLNLTGSCPNSTYVYRHAFALHCRPIVLYTYVYVVIVTKPVHRLLIRPIVHN